MPNTRNKMLAEQSLQQGQVVSSQPKLKFKWFLTPEKISKGIIYILVFGLPLFIWPWFSNVVDFPKQLLLVGLVIISGFLWLLYILGQETIEIKINPIYVVVFVFLLFWGISTLVSLSRYGSFWGWPLPVGESFVTLAGLVGFFFLVHQLISHREEIIWLLILLIVSLALVSIFGLLRGWGVLSLPWQNIILFNTIGPQSALAVLAAALLPIVANLVLTLKDLKLKIVLVAAGVAMFLIVLSVNAWFIWAVLLVGSAISWALTVAKQRFVHGLYNFKPLLPSIILVAISIFFLIVQQPVPGLPQSPPEVYPSYRDSFRINMEALKERPILGTGPGTFIFNYSKFKDPRINLNPFAWNIRFAKGTSDIIDILGSTGILGSIAFWGLLLFILYAIWRKLVVESELKFLDIGLISGLFGIIAAQALSAGSLTLEFVFWFILALFIIQSPLNRYVKSSRQILVEESSESIEENRLEIEKSEQPKSRFLMGVTALSENILAAIVSLAIILILIVGISFFYFGGKRVAADLYYMRGLQAFQQGDLNKAVTEVSKAINGNPGHDIYYRDLAQIQLALARQEISNIQSNQDVTRLMNIINGAVNSAITATQIEPNNVANWLVRGFVYRNLIGIYKDAEKAALSLGYEKALALEPANPFTYTEIGLVHIQNASLLLQQNQQDQAKSILEKAKQAFEKAVELKSDYAPAYFQLAVVADMLGDTNQVIQRLQDTKRYVTNPNDFAAISFQLGVIYYNSRNYQLAKVEFQDAISVIPNYSNARYFLGLIYDAEGNTQEAIKQFEKVAEFNPDNELVKTILSNLRQGLPALSGVTQERPPQPPPFLEEQPTEIKGGE